MMAFEEIVENLKKAKNHSVASTCLAAMTNEEVFFHKGFSKAKTDLTSLYTLRLDMAKTLNRDRFKDDELLIWENAIQNLENCDSQELTLNWVKAADRTYMMFWNTESKDLQAIFYLYQKPYTENTI